MRGEVGAWVLTMGWLRVVTLNGVFRAILGYTFQVYNGECAGPHAETAVYIRRNSNGLETD